jgi:hypothetical protein
MSLCKNTSKSDKQQYASWTQFQVSLASMQLVYDSTDSILFQYDSCFLSLKESRRGIIKSKNILIQITLIWEHYVMMNYIKIEINLIQM